MSRLVCIFQQVMSRTAPVCAFFILLYGLFCCDIDFHMTISHLPVPTMRLNLIASPLFQTMLQPGPVLPPIPKSAMDIPTFFEALDRWGQDTFLSYHDT